MKKLFLIVISVVAVYYIKPGLFTFSTDGAFDENGNAAVWVFTIDQCGKPCKKAISILDKRVDYVEFNVSSEKGKMQLLKIGGSNQFPLIVAGNRRILGDNKMFIVATLAEGIGTHAVTPSERRVLESHFYDDGTPAIVMYGTSWCPGCKKLREYFNNKNIEFIELDAEGSARTDFNILMGGGYPLTYIGYRRIIGLNVGLIEETMNEFNL